MDHNPGYYCPFHEDETSTIALFEDGCFLCHRCNARGDAIAWIIMNEGQSFDEAKNRLWPRS